MPLPLFGLAFQARPQLSAVTLGPAILTYPEIAAGLSLDGRRVVCSPALRQRAAVVSLHGKSWSSVQKALGDGLGIWFRPIQDGSWSMEESPDAATGDRKALDAYVSRVDLRAGDVMRRAGDLTHDWSRASLQAHRDDLLAAAANAQRQNDSVTASAAVYLLSIFDGAQTDPLTAWVFLEAGGLRSLLRHDRVVYGGADYGNQNDVAPWAVWPRPAIASDSESDRLQRVAFDPVGGQIFFSRRTSSGPTGPGASVIETHVLEDQFAPSSLPEAEAEAAPNLTAGEEARKAMETPAPALKTDRSIAGFLERWAKASGADLAMEVSPVRDELPFGFPNRGPATVRDALWPRPVDTADVAGRLQQSDPSFLSRPAAIRKTARLLGLIRLRPWSMRVEDGVFVVANRFRFLDREFPLPFAALLAVRRARSDDGAVPLETLLRASAAISQDDMDRVERCRPALAPSGFGDLHPFGQLLVSLSPQARLAVEDALARTGTARVPFASFDTAARTVFLRSLRQNVLAWGDPEWRQPRLDYEALVLDPDFEASLRQTILALDVSQSGATLTVRLLLPGGSEADPSEAVPLAEVSVEGVSPTPGEDSK